MSVKRVYVEKKPEFAVKAGELREEISSYLSIDTVTGVRVLIRYDIENLSEETYKQALVTIFSEPPVDYVYEEDFPKQEGDTVFSVEYLPGQFDQRADSAEQCVKLLKETEEPVIKTATTYVLSGRLTEEQAAAIKAFCINPVDSREAGSKKPETLVTVFETPADVASFTGFTTFDSAKLKELYDSLNLAMTFKDFQHIQNYFRGEENRDHAEYEIVAVPLRQLPEAQRAVKSLRPCVGSLHGQLDRHIRIGQPEQAERQLRRPLSVAPPLLPDVEKIAPAVGIGPCREAQKADRLPALVFDQAGIVILRGQIGPAERKPHGVHKFPLLICQAAAVSRVDQVVPRGHRPDADELVFPFLRRDPQQLFPQRHPTTSLQFFLQFITKYRAGQD